MTLNLQPDDIELNNSKRRKEAAKMISKVMDECLERLEGLEGPVQSDYLADEATVLFYRKVVPVLNQWKSCGANNSNCRSILLDIMRTRIKKLKSSRLRKLH